MHQFSRLPSGTATVWLLLAQAALNGPEAAPLHETELLPEEEPNERRNP